MTAIHILGISGSPRKMGNSRYLLDVMLDSAKEYAPDLVRNEVYSISGKTFLPCDACDQCHDQLGFCRQTDDDFGELRDKWLTSIGTDGSSGRASSVASRSSAWFRAVELKLAPVCRSTSVTSRISRHKVSTAPRSPVKAKVAASIARHSLAILEA